MIDKVDKVFLFQSLSLCLRQLKWAIRKYMMLAKMHFYPDKKNTDFLHKRKYMLNTAISINSGKCISLVGRAIADLDTLQSGSI